MDPFAAMHAHGSFGCPGRMRFKLKHFAKKVVVDPFAAMHAHGSFGCPGQKRRDLSRVDCVSIVEL